MILGVLQARMTSSRLPGKALADLLGQPMLGRQVERLRRSARVDRLVLATSEDPSDDPLAAYAATIGLETARGSLTDVLARFLTALDLYPQASTLVRLTADCPLTDWRVLDEAIDHHLATGADYTDNTLGAKTYPHGLDVEVLKPDALRAAGAEATDPYDHEHVTPFVYNRPDRFKLAWITRQPSLAHLRWTVDYPEDLEFVRHIYASLYPADPDFGTDAVAALPWNSSRAKV